MYDKLFNVLAVLTVIGVGFISCSLPYALEGNDEPEVLAPLKAPKFPDGPEAPDVSLAFEIKANFEAAKKTIDEVIGIKAQVDTVEPELQKLTYVGDFYITCYAATVEQCGNSFGYTASGRKVTADPTCHTVAVDPAVIPLGSYLIIDLPEYEGVIFRADDTGSAINGYDIDIFSESEIESKTFDNKSGVAVWIIEEV